MNPFDILGISEAATQDEVKQAYFLLAKKYHPDVSNNKDSFMFEKIKAAYDAISNENYVCSLCNGEGFTFIIYKKYNCEIKEITKCKACVHKSA
jgi:DnaJ domain